MQRKKLISLIQSVLIGLCLLTVACIPLVITYGPGLARKYRAGKATSADAQTRLLGLNYIVKNAPRDAGTRQAAVALMEESEDDANFFQIMRALDAAGVWNRQTVPAPVYLRWLTILSKDINPANRMVVSQYIGELSDIASNPGVIALMSTLMNDTDDQARYSALVACADLAHAGKNPVPYLALMNERTLDPNAKIAQQAWIMLGSLKEAKTLPENLAKRPDAVVQAAAWALVVSQAPGAEQAIAGLVLDDAVAFPSRTGAVYALKAGKHGVTPETLQRLISQLQLPGVKAPATTLNPANAWLYWRAVLAFPFNAQNNAAMHASARHILSLQSKETIGDPSWNMLFSAAYHQLAAPEEKAGIVIDHHLKAFEKLLVNPMFALAYAEGLAPGSLPGARPTSEMPDSIKLAVLRAADAIKPDDIYPLLSHDAAHIRDQACIIAWQQMPKKDQGELVAKLLKDYNDNAKMSGGFLAGLTGTQPELLARRVRDEDVWAVQQILRLGLFMQTPGEPIRPFTQDHDNLRGLLMRPDLPRSTITLGLLFKHDDGPLEFLFNPRGEPYLPLIEMFDDKRWWHALEPVMPNNMPGFEVWADPGLMTFQIDLMRNWYLVNKRNLTWPARESIN